MSEQLEAWVPERADDRNVENAITYEECQWDLSRGNLAGLIKRLDAWTPATTETAWALRKAGLLAELGEDARACALLEATLAWTRQAARRDIDDIASLSLEGWALYLALPYSQVGWRPNVSFSSDEPEPFERWRSLAPVDCNSFAEYRDRIANLVPDLDYRPGGMHKRLLRLPWADVFSTNWDSLLERTCPDVFERSYEIVRTISDIPFAISPRIVKLHGSFPSHQPYIFTEEEYRTYPTKFAPFVNLVQQSMMETTFCLIGFSGDDPNFLHWSGWVRDNLGSNAPRIYLVGCLRQL